MNVTKSRATYIFKKDTLRPDGIKMEVLQVVLQIDYPNRTIEIIPCQGFEKFTFKNSVDYTSRWIVIADLIKEATAFAQEEFEKLIQASN